MAAQTFEGAFTTPLAETSPSPSLTPHGRNFRWEPDRAEARVHFNFGMPVIPSRTVPVTAGPGLDPGAHL